MDDMRQRPEGQLGCPAVSRKAVKEDGCPADRCAAADGVVVGGGVRMDEFLARSRHGAFLVPGGWLEARAAGAGRQERWVSTFSRRGGWLEARAAGAGRQERWVSTFSRRFRTRSVTGVGTIRGSTSVTCNKNSALTGVRTAGGQESGCPILATRDKPALVLADDPTGAIHQLQVVLERERHRGGKKDGCPDSLCVRQERWVSRFLGVLCSKGDQIRPCWPNSSVDNGSGAMHRTLDRVEGWRGERCFGLRAALLVRFRAVSVEAG
jgi:hypothetical protein